MAIKNILGVLIITFIISSCSNKDNVLLKGTYPAGSGESPAARNAQYFRNTVYRFCKN